MEEFVNNNKPLANQASEYLTRWIQKSRFKPGDKLPTEVELARKMNVGRSTVREALTILRSRNIIEVRRGCGTYLSEQPGVIDDPLGLNFVQNRRQLALDWCHVRMIIEPDVAALAAKNATPEDIEQLHYWNNRVEEDIANNVPHMESDIAFHRAVSAAGKNVVMSRLVPVISEGIQQFMEYTNYRESEETCYFHREILKGIEQHDEERARSAMENLLKVNQMYLNEMLDQKAEEKEN